VPILPSRSQVILGLVDRLASGRAAEREAAVARLTLVGPRALPALIAVLPTAGPTLRLGVLEVLGRLREPRSRPEVQALCRDQDAAVARRALAVLPAVADEKSVAVAARILAEGPADRREAAASALAGLHARGFDTAMEPLLDLVLDETEGEALRAFVLGALRSVDPGAAEALLPRLAAGLGALGAEVAAASAGPGQAPADGIEAKLRRLSAPGVAGEEALRIGRELKTAGVAALPALHAGLEQARRPRELAVLADVLGHLRSATSIPVLSRALQRLDQPTARRTDEGLAAARAKLHLALSALDSRIALFDLRERLEGRPLLDGAVLLEAAERIGDVTLVAGLARIHAEERTLRASAARSFAAIAGRERLRASSARFKKLPAADQAAVRELFATLKAAAGRRPAR
jgi:hypothetical protein